MPLSLAKLSRTLAVAKWRGVELNYPFLSVMGPILLYVVARLFSCHQPKFTLNVIMPCKNTQTHQHQHLLQSLSYTLRWDRNKRWNGIVENTLFVYTLRKKCTNGKDNNINSMLTANNILISINSITNLY